MASSLPESKDLLRGATTAVELPSMNSPWWTLAEQVPRLALAAQARLKTALVMTVDTQILPLVVTDFVVRESLQTQSNSVNYESACTWDICSLSVLNEMVSWSLSRRSRGPWEEKITSTKSTSGSCA